MNILPLFKSGKCIKCNHTDSQSDRVHRNALGHSFQTLSGADDRTVGAGAGSRAECGRRTARHRRAQQHDHQQHDQPMPWCRIGPFEVAVGHFQ